MNRAWSVGAAVLALAALAACQSSSLELRECPDNRPSYAEFVAANEFPYSALPDRQRRVVESYSSLEVGMSAGAVAALLGEPDWGGCAYEKEPPRELIGFSWTYSFRKPSAEFTNEVDDLGVMVFFDNTGAVRWVVPRGVEGLVELGSPRTRDG